MKSRTGPQKFAVVATDVWPRTLEATNRSSRSGLNAATGWHPPDLVEVRELAAAAAAESRTPLNETDDDLPELKPSHEQAAD
jgi:hypothetical protein